MNYKLQFYPINSNIDLIVNHRNTFFIYFSILQTLEKIFGSDVVFKI
jgi:hypothetical protein